MQCRTTCRRNNANQHYLPYIYICTCAGTKQLDIHKTCAVTLTGKRPLNRDPELQRTELVQDTKALMVQDTKFGVLRPVNHCGYIKITSVYIYIYRWQCFQSPSPSTIYFKYIINGFQILNNFIASRDITFVL